MRWKLWLWPLLLGSLTACAPKLAPEVTQTETRKSQAVVETQSPAQRVTPDSIQEAETETEIIDAKTRKLRFFALLKPLAEAENARILKLRQRVSVLKRKARAYTQNDMQLIRKLAQNYRIPLSGQPTGVFWARLEKRVDVVPVELALAQAANESAWGTSRFARQGNNFFGQWCYVAGCGIVPTRRNAGATHEVKAFDSPGASVQAYIHNLNTTSAYKSLRGIRLHLRRAKQPLNALILASGLAGYSERGAAYVKSIQTIIRHNRTLMQAAASD